MLSKQLIDHLAEGMASKRAYDFAREQYQGHVLPNGDSMLERALANAEMMLNWRAGDEALIAAMLRDLPMASSYEARIKTEFGEDVLWLIQKSLAIHRINFRETEATMVAVRKFILQLCPDVRILLLVLARRLHDARFLYVLPPAERQRVAIQNMKVYAVLAYQIGLNEVSGELADLSFPHAYPQEHQWLINNLQDRYEEWEKYTESLVPILELALRERGIRDFRIEHRAKRYASLHHKLTYRYEMALGRVGDLVALRVIVPTVNDCYAVLGVAHQLWAPVPDRIKDYIAYPKPNGYRSLHTTLFTNEDQKKLIEIQIRTEGMHYHAEYGPAADYAYHFRTSPAMAGVGVGLDIDGATLMMLRRWREVTSSGFPAKGAYVLNLFADRVFLFTPKGDVFDLPQGATPLDLAYRIHTDIGHRADRAVINGVPATLAGKLCSGDVVEILLRADRVPLSSSLARVKTRGAREKIRAALRSAAEYFHHSG